MNGKSKKILVVALIAAVSSVAVYAYVQSKKKEKRKTLPITFM